MTLTQAPTYLPARGPLEVPDVDEVPVPAERVPGLGHQALTDPAGDGNAVHGCVGLNIATASDHAGRCQTGKCTLRGQSMSS
jgi:hypothetical protein